MAKAPPGGLLGLTLFEDNAAHRELPIPSLRARRAGIPAVLDAIFQKMVAKRPEERFQTMNEVVNVLQSVM